MAEKLEQKVQEEVFNDSLRDLRLAFEKITEALGYLQDASQYI